MLKTRMMTFLVAIALTTVISQAALAAPPKSSAGTPERIPAKGQVYKGALPTYLAPPKFSDIGYGYAATDTLSVQREGKTLNEWIFDARKQILKTIRADIIKFCEREGYTKSAVASDLDVSVDSPVNSFIMINYYYQFNCW